LGENEKINKVLSTSFISIFFFLTCIVIIIFLIAVLYIDKIVPPEYVRVAISVLPYSLLCLLINSLGAVFTSALEGFQKNYIRNLVYIFTSIGYFVLALLLLPKLGLKGLAIAQIGQAMVIFFIAVYQVKKICPSFRLLYWNWDKSVFHSLFNYGYKFQLISILQMLYEPMTKILISKFSGISTLGFYEMATRFVSQFRAIISTMNQVTVPVVAHYFQTDKNAIKLIYKRSLSFVIFLVFPIVAGIVLFTPHLSVIWIGNIEPIFINSSYILSISMLINVLNAPAYFNSLGEGNLNGLLIMHLLIACVNIILGITLGTFVNTYGVIIAWAISLCSGSVFLILYYHKKNHLVITNVISKSDFLFMLLATVFIILSMLFFTKISLALNFSRLSFFVLLGIYIVFFAPLAIYNGNLKLLEVFRKSNKYL
jgi:O-antigen/teichoic acid export membrane protein